jgi:TRAP transporter TAXI family solute receptor
MNKLNATLASAGIAGATTLALGAATALAADVKLPKQISWTAYGTTSSGYAQSVGIGQMLEKKYHTGLRIIPGKNDVSRMVPLRAGQTPLCACGIAAYFAQEGVFMFATKKWGPMRIYNLFNNIGDNGSQAVATKDVGIKSVKDFKGKRVTWVKGSPALNTNMTAMLAFGGLTWNDVTKVVVPGFKQSCEAVINGQADVSYGSTVTSAYNKLAASPRGIYWVSLPHSDKEGWKRALAIAPYWAPANATVGVDLKSNEEGGKLPHQTNNYPYPIFVATAKASNDLTYGLTKAVMENYEDIKDAGPSMSGYRLSRQNLTWSFPYHPGAIAYYKEKGVWTDEAEKHNQMLLKRQDVLAATWKKVIAKKNLSGDAFTAAWLKARAAALEAAGMPVPFKD